MGDTPKIDKVRVDGVLYDLVESGGGGGGGEVTLGLNHQENSKVVNLFAKPMILASTDPSGVGGGSIRRICVDMGTIKNMLISAGYDGFLDTLDGYVGKNGLDFDLVFTALDTNSGVGSYTYDFYIHMGIDILWMEEGPAAINGVYFTGGPRGGGESLQEMEMEAPAVEIGNSYIFGEIYFDHNNLTTDSTVADLFDYMIENELPMYVGYFDGNGTPYYFVDYQSFNSELQGILLSPTFASMGLIIPEDGPGELPEAYFIDIDGITNNLYLGEPEGGPKEEAPSEIF